MMNKKTKHVNEEEEQEEEMFGRVLEGHLNTLEEDLRKLQEQLHKLQDEKTDPDLGAYTVAKKEVEIAEKKVEIAEKKVEQVKLNGINRRQQERLETAFDNAIAFLNDAQKKLEKPKRI